MEPQLCLNCNTPIEGKEGKRAKKYCNDACRASHWSKTHSKKGIRWVRKEVYDAVVKERDELLRIIKGEPNLGNNPYDGKHLPKGYVQDEYGQYEMPKPVEKPPVIKDKVVKKPIEDNPKELSSFDKIRNKKMGISK